uniref:Major Facilitator Superfamily (MFS) putative n=1 Tax=Albugo laibachii Nc14 TaxID=890382 RepID=F0X2M3_9STRA|nr:Major Facilitator Superfamily (MFS) putative [Albugo laibachii Nc14]|eukprot:CCA28138.1 Major Facilitator Superfamily (MFS) putative [Albugo laibachii Nc14]
MKECAIRVCRNENLIIRMIAFQGDIYWPNIAGMRRVLSIVSGALVMLALGSNQAISVWNADLKERLHYTQSEISAVCALASLGVYSSISTGYLFDRMGAHNSVLCSALVLSGLYICLSIELGAEKHLSASFVGILFVLIGQSSNFGVFASLTCNEGLYGCKNRGKIMSVLLASYSAGAAVFSTICRKYFAHDVQLYFRFLGITMLFVLLLAYVALYREEKEAGLEEVSQDVSEKIVPVVDISDLALLKDTRFWLLFLIVLILVGGSLFVMANIFFIVESLQGPVHQIPWMVAMFSLGNFTGRIITGVVSDHLVARIPRVYYIAFAACLNASNQLLFLNICSMWLIFPISIAGITDGMVFSTFPVLVRETFGSRHFGKNFGYISLANAVGFPLFLSPISSLIYSHFATSSGPNNVEICVGLHCFQVIFYLIGFLSLVALIACVRFAQIGSFSESEKIVDNESTSLLPL